MPPQNNHPRVGIPYRTWKEQLKGARDKYELYLAAVRASGGAPVEISLDFSTEALQRMAETLDAIVLPGSPADVDPALYSAAKHPKTAESDARLERTDRFLLAHALAEGKPVLAICYGAQILNVHLGGSLVQDIPSEIGTAIQHTWEGRAEGKPEPFHGVKLQMESQLAKQHGAEARVNSSHHQSVREPGRNLRIAAVAPDGIVEAVEWTGDANWVVGVQWHPERNPEDALSRILFEHLIAVARDGAVRA